jgi:hypothetical protein
MGAFGPIASVNWPCDGHAGAPRGRSIGYLDFDGVLHPKGVWRAFLARPPGLSCSSAPGATKREGDRT